jgi:mono/diheme cytochrome c family protein
METLLFVLLWAALAIGLLMLALFGGRRRRGGVNARRGGRTWWYVAFAGVLLVFGAAVPIASSLGTDDASRQVPKAGISDLTDAQAHGRQLFGKYCALCHSLEAANAVANVGPNLDDLRPTRELVLNAINQGRARGNGAMAANLVQGEDAQDVADFVAAAVGQTGN